MTTESITKLVESVMRPRFENRMFDVTADGLVTWCIMSRKNQLARAPTPQVVLLVTAITWTNNRAVATREVAPFVACGIPTPNPCSGEGFKGD